jgi:Domain of unknown function (DUF5916)/Carbohydrate family 9 binding domain-like
MALFLALAAALQAQEPVREVEGRGRPTVEIPRVEAEVRIDGILDEDVWSKAVRLTGFSQYEPVDGRPAEERTVVRVWYAPDAIFFGIEAYDDDPASIRATNADRDNIDNDDHVIIYLDTFNDRRRSVFFGVNPLGVQQDGIRSEGSSSAGRMFGGNIDTNPDFFFESRGRLTSEGYVVEVRIPFSSLRFPGGNSQEWGINVLRQVKRTGYTDTWTDVRRASNSFLVQAGTLSGLHDLKRGIVLEAQPFLTATANGTRSDATGRFQRDDVNPDAGINLRVGLTNLSLDGTVNPDFSQVESDAGQVTANERFALFYPEKRPFFLENIDLFSAPNQLVYTRQIVNPLAGAKVTGKLGAIGVAHLTAVDEGINGASNALFNVTRLRRDFGTGSVAGLLFTDRSVLDGPGYNRLVAADARVTFASLYYVEVQAGRSWTRSDSTTTTAPVLSASLDRTGRLWGFNYSISAFGSDFNAAAGFVPRNDIVSAHGFNRLSLYGERGALLESLTIFSGPSRIWTYDGFGRNASIEGNENVNLMTRFRGGWQVSGKIERDFVHLEPSMFEGYTTVDGSTYSGIGEVSGPTLQASVTTPTFQHFAGNVSVERSTRALFAEGSKGRGLSLTGVLTLRPSESLRFESRNTLLRLTRADDGSEYSRTVIPRLKAEYQPTRALFFRFVVEHTSQRNDALREPRTGDALVVDGATSTASLSSAVRFDLLGSYEPVPGTVIFLGYGSSLSAQQSLELRDLDRVADGFFLKLAYQFRR